MRKSLIKLSLVSGMALSLIAGTSALALVPTQKGLANGVGGQPTQKLNTTTTTTNSSQPSNVSSTSSTTSTNSSSPTSNPYNGGINKNSGPPVSACQAHQEAITNIMNLTNERGQNQLKLFTTVASNVEAFYVKSGKTVSNYTSLTSAVTTAANTAQSGLAQLSGSKFTCNASNPKGMITAFQGYLKSEISDLQGLKMAVKNLIVAVAQANGIKVNPNSTS